VTRRIRLTGRLTFSPEEPHSCLVHGGPLWEPLRVAQMGGLSFATVVTLLLVPVLYTIFVEDLPWVRWDPRAAEDDAPGAEVAAGRSTSE
jgi:hypothetical protein